MVRLPSGNHLTNVAQQLSAGHFVDKPRAARATKGIYTSVALTLSARSVAEVPHCRFPADPPDGVLWPAYGVATFQPRPYPADLPARTQEPAHGGSAADAWRQPVFDDPEDDLASN